MACFIWLGCIRKVSVLRKDMDLATDYLYKPAKARWEPAIKIIKGEN